MNFEMDLNRILFVTNILHRENLTRSIVVMFVCLFVSHLGSVWMLTFFAIEPESVTGHCCDSIQ